MPYQGKELSMLIFLPNSIEDNSTGLEKVGHTRTCILWRNPFISLFIQTDNGFCVHAQLEKELTYERFVEWTHLDMMDEIEVLVSLPRFKMEESYDMKNVLVSMGMVDAFDQALSDFSGRTNYWIIMDQQINTKY